MNHPNYPNPCLKCQLPCASSGGPNYHKCSDYRTWFLWWWKYFRKIFGITPDGASLQVSANKFFYRHPEEIKRELLQQRKEVAGQICITAAKKPCARCKRESTCNTPYDAYLQWYDESLALIRKQVEL